jgi:hypothetical protein
VVTFDAQLWIATRCDQLARVDPTGRAIASHRALSFATGAHSNGRCAGRSDLDPDAAVALIGDVRSTTELGDIDLVVPPTGWLIVAVPTSPTRRWPTEPSTMRALRADQV